MSRLLKLFAIFTEAIDKTCKLDKPKIIKRNLITNPWITDSITDVIYHKEELYEIWNNSKAHNTVDSEFLYQLFNEYRKCLKHVIKRRKNMYYNEKFHEHFGDCKKTWETINQLRGKSKKSIKSQFVVDRVRVVERRIIANKFNEYFTSIALK